MFKYIILTGKSVSLESDISRLPVVDAVEHNDLQPGHRRPVQGCQLVRSIKEKKEKNYTSAIPRAKNIKSK